MKLTQFHNMENGSNLESGRADRSAKRRGTFYKIEESIGAL